ncbi:MAG: methyl-accepting chemotaxis protein [Nitrospinota bacterium]|nr:methyl-accepting chemotaxis protein [Nitrospinota bacterium]
MNLKKKVFGISVALISVVLFTSAMIISAANRTTDDADLVNAMGRQRMLTQAMAKSVLAFAQKGEFTAIKNTVHLLDNYISQMRAVYTKMVAGQAGKAGVELSMDPESLGHAALPFPATFTRLVNEKFVKENDLAGQAMTLDILSENPVNPEKSLKAQMDRDAAAFLAKNPGKIYSGTEERASGLFLIFYSPDIASVEACANCHQNLQGGDIKVGDMLGVRKFELLFTKDVEAGKSILNPTKVEYEALLKVFEQTINAFKSGGSFPIDLAKTQFKTTNRIEDKQARDKIGEIETQLVRFKRVSEELMSTEDELVLRGAQATIGGEANRLRALSDDLVTIYSKIAADHQKTIVWSAVGSALMITAVSLLLSLFVRYSILGPIESASAALRDIAEGEGDMTRRLPEKAKDEIGELSHWFNLFVENLSGIIGKIKNNSGLLASSSGKMLDVSTSLASGAEQMTSQANAVASATEQMSANIVTVASAVEEMSVNVSSVSTGAEEMSASMKTVSKSVDGLRESINKINTHAKEASGVAKQVQDRSRMAESAMKTLGQAANEIGKVTEVIKRIAEQTNLLALNATIEAASAGAAGKGFAVVANEIKQLASQSAGAAGDIASKIEGVQGNTERAVSVIGEVLSTINLINESVALITRSVEAQNNAAMEISSVVSQASTGADNIASSITEVAKGANEVSQSTGEAAKGANDVASNIHGVSQAAGQTSKSAHAVSATSRDIAKIAQELEGLVSRFQVERRGH